MELYWGLAVHLKAIEGVCHYESKALGKEGFRRELGRGGCSRVADGGQEFEMGLFGGPDRDRTDDLFHAMEARSQLRHRPTLGGTCLFSRMRAGKSNHCGGTKGWRRGV